MIMYRKPKPLSSSVHNMMDFSHSYICTLFTVGICKMVVDWSEFARWPLLDWNAYIYI